MQAGQTATVGADPQAAVRGDGKGQDPVVGQVAVVGGEHLPLTLVQAGQTTVGADPQAAVRGDGKGPDPVVGQVAVVGGEHLPLTLVQAGQTATEVPIHRPPSGATARDKTLLSGRSLLSAVNTCH